MKSYIVKIPLGNLKLTIASVLGDQSKLGLEQYDKVPEKVQNRIAISRKKVNMSQNKNKI